MLTEFKDEPLYPLHYRITMESISNKVNTQVKQFQFHHFHRGFHIEIVLLFKGKTQRRINGVRTLPLEKFKPK